MIRTERLYYSDPSAQEAEASIIGAEGTASEPVLVFDRTVFYPEGGGQPCDLGTVAGVAVSFVEESGGRILHHLAAPLAASPGERVRLVLDAARRRDHSEQHTGQHLLSSTLLRLFGAPTVSFHLGVERCTIDIDVPSLPDDDLAEAEARVDEVIADDYPLVVHLCPPEDPHSFPLRKKLPEGEAEIRVVEIDGIDFTPCCGTHLASTGRIRHLKILGAEKYKGMTRVTFVAGGRATAESFLMSHNVRETARAFGCSTAEVAQKAIRAAERLKALEQASAGLVRERAALEAELAAQRPGGIPGAMVLRYSDRGVDGAQEAVRAFTGRGAIAIAVSLPELTAIAASPKAGTRLGERLKPLALAASGKGGGGDTSFRASFPDQASLETFLAAAERELGLS